jgi:hypothetical protein
MVPENGQFREAIIYERVGFIKLFNERHLSVRISEKLMNNVIYDQIKRIKHLQNACTNRLLLVLTHSPPPDAHRQVGPFPSLLNIQAIMFYRCLPGVGSGIPSAASASSEAAHETQSKKSHSLSASKRARRDS